MDKTALITGASSGIGKEFAIYHAGKGGDVILPARRAEILKTLKSEIEEQYGVKAHVLSMSMLSHW